ncbi:protein binding protein [Genlisea aurea]|uniref:Protein binding protein n=1 Tax=Genlisea aurea TaxID=192259 RepID=S8C090_9LAMI|nr:protein binding protein [Genlisea aurea]
MAIASYPTPADAGVLCIILANTAISISIFKEILRSILNVIGIRISSWEELSVDPSDSSSECHRIPSASYREGLQSATVSCDSILLRHRLKQDCCTICLNEFELNAEVNRLCCGHIFHAFCLEKWLNYWNPTCPLCRSHMSHPEEEEASPM